MKKIFTIISILIFLLLGVFLIFKFDENRDIKLAKRYIKEYRFAKALSLLKNDGQKNQDLQQLLFYAAIKAKNFQTADVILEEIESFNLDFKNNFYEVISILYDNDLDEIINKMLAKSGKIGLKQDYLISLSKKQKNIDKEMQILLMGRKLFLDINLEVDKLEQYILERYMNQANLFIAHQDYKAALAQMQEAQILYILKETQQDANGETLVIEEFKQEKAKYKYLLGTIYGYLQEQSKSWELITQSAELGNLQAKDSLERAKRKYRP